MSASNDDEGPGDAAVPPDDLVQCAKRGDRDALGQLYVKYQAAVRKTSGRYASNRPKGAFDASEVAGRTWVFACENIAKFRGDSEEQFVAWLQIYARLLAKRMGSKESRHPHRSLDDSAGDGQRLADSLASDSSTPSHRASRNEEQQRACQDLAHALALLPPDQRTAIVLRQIEGCSLDDIARQLECPKKNVTALLMKGSKTLRRYLRKISYTDEEAGQ